jgi:HEAT repeat protein
MVDAGQIQAYLKGISRRYEQWRQDNALTDTIAHQQATFTFNQFVQTEEKQPGDSLKKEIKTYPLFEGICHYLLEKEEHVLLVGSPGVGKSSALWHCLDALAKEELEAHEPRIPVLIQLKVYRDSFVSAEDSYGFLTLIQTSIRPQLRLSLPEIDNLLCNQRLILLLDGLNEMPAGVFRTHLQQFRDECRELEIPLICSTRELGGGDLGIQRKLEIQPLQSRETNRFLRECLPEHQDQVRQLLQRDSRVLNRTPFVLWMLYHLLKETGTISETLGEAFRQFFRFYCRRYKEDAPVPEERRKAWNLWMEHLAFAMLSSPDPLDPGLVITKEKAENILVERFGGLQDSGSRILELEKYYLLAPVSDRETSFKHQLIQEYYAAEYFLEKLEDEPYLLQEKPEKEHTPFQVCYLNHLKWTEPLMTVMALLDSPDSRVREPQKIAKKISKLALETDLRLGSRIVGSASKSLQEHTVKLLLESNFQDSLKIWLLQQSKSTESILFLLNILRDGDSNHRWRAARALAKFDKKLVKDHLLRALGDRDDVNVRRIAAAFLKELGDGDMVAPLCRLLNSENDWLVLGSTVDYLGELGGKESIECLKSALQHPDSTVRSKAAEHLGRLSPSQTIVLLEKKLQQEDVESRKQAVYLLGQTKVSFAFYSLKKTLLENDWTLRSSAIYSIGTLGIWLGNFPKDIIKELVNILHHDPNPSVRSSAALYLGIAGTPVALEALRESLSNEEDITVRFSSIDALGRIGSSSATDDLLACLNQEDNKFIENVLRSLRLIKANKVLPKIRKYLNSKSSSLRREAVLSIGCFGDPQKDLPFLYKLLKDKSFSVRLCSAYALSQFGSRKGITVLKEALKTGNKDARRRALYGLQNFNGKVELSTIASVAIKDEEYSLRKDAIQFLRIFSHTQEVRAQLDRALRSSNETIARQAMNAAKILGHPETLETLNQIAKKILVIESPLEAMKEIQSRCGFYNLTIQKEATQEKEHSLMPEVASQSLSPELLSKIDQRTQEIDKRTLQMSNEPKNDFSGANFHAPVNFGDNPKGDFIKTQNNFHADAEVQSAVSELKILLAQLQDQHPSVNTESEALTIIDAEFTEVRASRNHKLETLQKQLLNPERHLQACKAAAGEVAKHYLEDSVWAKAIITYIDKLSEEPGYGA